MNMFDDLDDGFEPSPDAALPAVRARVKQLRARRRMTIGGAIAVVVVVGLATVAFALPGGGAHRGAQVEVRPNATPTPSTVAGGNARTSKRTAAVKATTTTIAKSSGKPASKPPTYRGQIVTPTTVHDPQDFSALQVTAGPIVLTVRQGNSTTATVTVRNAGSWSVTPPKPPCEVIEPNMSPPCSGLSLDTTSLAPGATRSYPVKIYAVHTPASGPQVAVDPGDYTISALYPHSNPLTLHVTSSLTAHLTPASKTLKAGDDFTVTLSVTNAADIQARYTYLPTSCGLSLVPSGEVCEQRTQWMMVPAHAAAGTFLSVNTNGAAPGTYHVRIGDQTLTVTVTG